MSRSTGRERQPSPLRNRNFRVYWLGGALSTSGTWLYSVTASVFMYDMTGSPFMVGVLNFANFLPILLFSILGGVVSDRYDRRKLIIWLSAFSTAMSAFVSVATFMGLTTPILLIAVSFVIGTAYSFVKPAVTAILPGLIGKGDLAHATAINTMQFQVGQVVGSSLSALLLTISDVWVAFALNSLTYAGPIVSMVLLWNVVAQERSGKVRGLAAIKEGFTFVMGRGGLLAVFFAIIFTNSLVEALRTLSPVFAEQGVGLTSSEAGLLIGAISSGSVVAILSFGRILEFGGRKALVRLGFSLQLVGGAVVAPATTLWVALFGCFLVGIGFSLIIPLLNAVMQERSPDALRGRVAAAFSMAHLGSRPLNALLAGSLASFMGPRWTIVAFLLAAIIGFSILKGGKVVSEAPSADGVVQQGA